MIAFFEFLNSFSQSIISFFSFFFGYISSLFTFIYNIYTIIPSIATSLFSNLPSYYQVGFMGLISLAISLLALKFISMFF